MTSKPTQTFTPGTFGPTEAEAIPQLLGLLRLSDQDTLADIGCGDARILIAACQATGCRGIGYEIQPSIARLAEQRVAAAGLADRITIIEGDARQTADLAGLVVYSYSWPAVTTPLAEQLRRAARVVSYQHQLPLPAEQRRIMVGGRPRTVYLWEGPTRVPPATAAGRLDLRQLDREWGERHGER